MSDNDNNRPAVPRRATKDVYPLDLAKEFHDGKANGKWSTIKEASIKLGVMRPTLTRAVQVSGLPEDIRYLFMLSRSLTSGGAAQLIEIKKEIGLEQLLQRARRADPCSAVRTAQNVLDELRGKNILPYDSVNIRVTRGSGNKFLKIESAHPEILIKYRKEIQKAVKGVVMKRIAAAEFVEIDALLREKMPAFWSSR